MALFGSIILILFILFLALVSDKPTVTSTLPKKTSIHLSEIILISTASCGILYSIFFVFSKFIYSFYTYLPPLEFNTKFRQYLVHDGIEAFVLYCLMFAATGLSLLVTILIKKTDRSSVLRGGLLLAAASISVYFLTNIGFNPPFPSIDSTGIILPLFITMFSAGLYLLYKGRPRPVTVFILLLSAFAGLVNISPFSGTDFSYIVAPALRLMSGFKFQEVYFQYDIYLSLLSLVLMKMSVPLAWIAYVGQASYFLLFAGLFLVSGRFFKSNGLSVLFIIALMLVRYYSYQTSWQSFFQTTPLRLDLWVILFFVVQKKGHKHWLLGVCIGLLVLFHRNLGVIYLLCYIELLAVLFFIDLATETRDKKIRGKSIQLLLGLHLKNNGVNLILVSVSLALCFLFFNGLFSPAAETYRRYGLGMIPISSLSFYWYVPILVCCISILLFSYKDRLGAQYVSTCIFTILLAIGNSMYFFGRSHEYNILTISAIILLVLFILFDILLFLFPEMTFCIRRSNVRPAQVKQQKGNGELFSGRLFLILPAILIFSVGFYYSNSISAGISIQLKSLAKGKVANSLGIPKIDTAAIHKITSNSPKVYFLDFEIDFYYYYYSGYPPLGFYSPCESWQLKKDYLYYLQGLLDNGYYIVYNSQKNSSLNEYIIHLKYNKMQVSNEMISISKKTERPLLPDTNALLHTGLNFIGKNVDPVAIGEQFTLEAVVMPIAPQPHDAMILYNITGVAHLIKGMSLQLDGDNQHNAYTFCIGNGTSTIPRVYFTLADKKWNYIAIQVSRQTMNVYINGVIAATAPTGGLPYVNSDIPITIGNNADTSFRFNGNIADIKISNAIISEADITQNWKSLKDQLGITDSLEAKKTQPTDGKPK